jgi:hypothetical protein
MAGLIAMLDDVDPQLQDKHVCAAVKTLGSDLDELMTLTNLLKRYTSTGVSLVATRRHMHDSDAPSIICICGLGETKL